MTGVFSKMTVPTQNYGNVEFWLEARVNNPSGISYGEVWASSLMHDGKRYHGTDVTAAKAVADVIQNVQIDRGPEEPPAFPGHSYGMGFTNTCDPARPEPGETPPAPEYKGLPAAFWEAIKDDRKITAIKELRDATNLTLVAAKSLVDYIIPAGKSHFTAVRAETATVIRIHGGAASPMTHQGWVYEKETAGWTTPGLGCRYTSRDVQADMDEFGFDIIFTPKEG